MQMAQMAQSEQELISDQSSVSLHRSWWQGKRSFIIGSVCLVLIGAVAFSKTGQRSITKSDADSISMLAASDCEYQKGEINTNECPDGYFKITTSEDCSSAGTSLEVPSDSSGIARFTGGGYPSGCAQGGWGTGKLNWNPASEGGAQSSMTPICSSCDATAADAPTPAPADTDAPTPAPAPETDAPTPAPEETEAPTPAPEETEAPTSAPADPDAPSFHPGVPTTTLAATEAPSAAPATTVAPTPAPAPTEDTDAATPATTDPMAPDFHPGVPTTTLVVTPAPSAAPAATVAPTPAPTHAEACDYDFGTTLKEGDTGHVCSEDKPKCSPLSGTCEQGCNADFGAAEGDDCCCSEFRPHNSVPMHWHGDEHNCKLTAGDIKDNTCGEDQPHCIGFTHGVSWGYCGHKCVADHGTEIGDNFCCGQCMDGVDDFGVPCKHSHVVMTDFLCPETAPHCTGLKYGHVWGTCGMQCMADFGSSTCAGDPSAACVPDAKYTCPESAPTCTGYTHGKDWGTCGAA